VRGSRRRRLLRDLTARDVDELRRFHDEAVLDRYLAEQEASEERELVDPVEAARAARVLRERRDG
jgi:hypothetical protein